MRIRVSTILKTVAFVCAATVAVQASALVLKSKESDYKYADFFDKAKAGQIDVLFIGSSHVINGINPATLYKEYGITSYNMGGHGAVMQETYWMLKEALNYCTPKCVVVDTFMLQKNYQYLDVMSEEYTDEDRESSIGQLHQNMDCWPLDDTKVAAIEDLISSREIRKQFLVPFYIYHNRWEELDANDYKVLTGTGDRNTLFGAEMRYGMELRPGIYPGPDDDQGLGGDTVGEKYLVKIIDECQNRGIDVITTFLTCSATTEDKRAMDSVRIICDTYDVPFVNMQNLGVVDLYTDLNDTGHMNALGSIKASMCIGEVLQDMGTLQDHRGDLAYMDWQDKSEEFYETIRELAVSSDNIYQQLDYLTSGSVSSVIYINENSQAFWDDQMKRLIHNFSGTPNIYHTRGPYVLINDVASGVVSEASGKDTLDGVKTGLGTVHYEPVEQLFRLFYTDENPDFNYLYADDKYEYDIQIITYDKDTGEILSHNYYKSYGSNYTKG